VVGTCRVTLVRVDWPSGRASPCFGLIVQDGRVVQAAPIAKWSVGQSLAHVRRYFEAKGATVERVTP